jgi:hypothetical protein
MAKSHETEPVPAAVQGFPTRVKSIRDHALERGIPRSGSTIIALRFTLAINIQPCEIRRASRRFGDAGR